MDAALNKYQWDLTQPANGCDVDSLARAMNVPVAGARMLCARGVTGPDDARRFLFGEDLCLHDPFLFDAMDEAVKAVKRAVRDERPVLVHGDYDVDGISGTALLFKFLDKTVPRVFRYLPERRREGYGVSRRAVDWAIKNDVGLFIAVDCGTSDGEVLSLARDAGLDVIVCDHHEFPKDQATVGIMLNPVREGESYPFRGLCGAGVAFKLVQALEQAGVAGGVPCESLLDLVALATVGDLAPLVDENRLLVRLGLESMNRNMRLGLAALRSSARLEATEIRSSHIGFNLAPRLNAPGRVGHPKPALELLCAEDARASTRLASRLETDNEHRRDLTDRVKNDVLEIIHSMPDWTQEPGFVLASDDWDEGVLGIAASRVVDDFGRPALLISTQGDVAKGSGRSIPGVHLKAALDRCADLLVRFGGHAGAVGFSIDRDRIDTFRREFTSNLRAAAPAMAAKPRLQIDAELTVADCTMDLIDFLAACEPFGFGNPNPIWRLSNLTALPQTRFVGRGHLKLHAASRDGGNVEAIAFGFEQRGVDAATLHGRELDIAVTLQKGNFQDRIYPELRVTDLRWSEGA